MSKIELQILAYNQAAEKLNEVSVGLQTVLWREWGHKAIQNSGGGLKKKFLDQLSGLIKGYGPDFRRFTIWHNASPYSFSINVRASVWTTDKNASQELCNGLFDLRDGVIVAKRTLPALRINWTVEEIEKTRLTIRELEDKISVLKRKLPF